MPDSENSTIVPKRETFDYRRYEFFSAQRAYKKTLDILEGYRQPWMQAAKTLRAHVAESTSATADFNTAHAQHQQNHSGPWPSELRSLSQRMDEAKTKVRRSTAKRNVARANFKCALRALRRKTSLLQLAKARMAEASEAMEKVQQLESGKRRPRGKNKLERASDAEPESNVGDMYAEKEAHSERLRLRVRRQALERLRS